MAALSLLARARSAGLTVTVREGKLQVRGPKRLAALAMELAEHKAEVLAALEAEVQAGPPRLAEDTAELPSWFWRPAETRGSPGAGRMGARAPASCHACGSIWWWRRIAGGPWVCPVCHPPGPAPHEIEWSDAEVTS